MTNQFEGSVALVTGASRGIGFAIAERLLRDGAMVGICSRSSTDIQAAARKLGDGAIPVAADVTDPADVERLFADVSAARGPVNLLVNNAGTNQIGAAEDFTLAQWRALLDSNLTSALLCAQAFHAQSAGYGAIVNIGSLTSLVPFAERLPYSVAKAGVAMLTRVLAAEWAPAIRVNAVAPGYVATDLIREQVAAGQLQLDAVLSRVPLGRLAEPHDIAAAAAFLLSAEAAYVTGAVLLADGGFLANFAPTASLD